MKILKEATVKANKEEAIRAIDIIESIVLNEENMNDFYHSGDKDTRDLAFRIVMSKYKANTSSIHDMDSDAIEKYGKEINDVFLAIIENGKKQTELHNSILSYLKDLRICVNESKEENMGFGSYKGIKEFIEETVKCEECNLDLIVEVSVDENVVYYKNHKCQECIEKDLNSDKLPF